MKRIIRGALACMLALGFVTPVRAQQMPELPVDESVVSGVLPNGLHYYIRHNETPKGQADFYIAQKVGSVLEEENQRGLAHFLEHMCFNGTKNFPGGELISWLESIGVKFGAQLNAQTGTDQTIYMITNVPTARTEVTDSVLLILHDWANELTLDPKEIDKERGVIHEEWRTNSVGSMRIIEQLLPELYPGSQYAYRLPIGTIDVIDNFPYQALRDYYEKWYRPDLQGIIVCGDVDPARTEKVITEMFGDIEMPANAAERTEFPVPDTPGTIYAAGADKEMPQNVVYLMFKQDVVPQEMRNTPLYLTYDYITDNMICDMLNARFQEMMTKPDAPFGVAQAQFGNYLIGNTKNSLDFIGVTKGDEVASTLKGLYREVLRAARGGFTATEYDRARAEYLATIDKVYNNRATLENSFYTGTMVDHFVDGTPMMSVENECETMKMIAQMIDVNMINQAFAEMITNDNRVVLVMLSDKAPLPTKEEMAAWMAEVDAEEIEVFKDSVREDPLIPSLPAAGSVIASAPLEEFEGTECWTLSNGAKVYAKHTDFKQDEIIFTASAPGGLSQVFTTTTAANAIALKNLYAGEYGIGTYNSSDLQKYLTGKKASFSPSFDLYDTGASGSATPKDLPTLMELIYGYFTSVSYPAEEFEATRSLYYGLIKNQETNPQYVFGVDLYKAMYESPYMQTFTSADLMECTREGVETLARSRFNDASQWSFTFVGNFDAGQLKALCEQYIATLPSSNSPAVRITKGNPAYEVKAGSEVSTFTTAMETPQTWCAVIESATMPFTSMNAKLASVSGQIMSARLLRNIREEMGAVYSISAQGDIDPQEGMNAQLLTAFPMNPDQKQTVLDAIKAEFNAMAENVGADELAKVKEFMVKSYIERMEQNPAWATYINRWSLTGKNLFVNAVEEVNGITTEDVQNYVKALNEQKNYRVVILDPQ